MAEFNLSELVVNKIYGVIRINVAAGIFPLRRNREMDALAMKISGKTFYYADGKAILSSPERVVLLPKGSSYSFECVEQGECLMIEFDSNLSSILPKLHSFKVISQSEFSALYYKLERLWTFKKPAYSLKCVAGLYEMIAKLQESETKTYNFSSKYHIIAPSLKFLEQNYNCPNLTNQKLAEISLISEVYFRKIFSAIYFTSPQKYIEKIRVEKAKDMLISELASVSEIATLVGFSGVYYFCKVFKKIVGLTPTEFRRQFLLNSNIEEEMANYEQI